MMERLLIIDDNDTDRFLIKKALLKERASLDLIELQQGFEATKTIKEKAPLATLLDIRMPGIDGFEVLENIRNDPKISNHPVFMLSGSEEPKDKELAYKTGASGYMVKPTSFGEYVELAKKLNCSIFKD